jgi:MFS family permease
MVEPQRSNSNTLLAFLASTHFITHVYTQLLPVLLLPLRDELGVSLVQISLLASIPRLFNVVAYIPSGITADRHPALILTASFVVIERYGTTVIFPISIVALVPTMGLILLLGKMRKS